MNMHRKRQPGSMLLITIVLGALLGACGAEQPTGKTTNTVSGVVPVGRPAAGLNTCMSCHPVTTADWLTTRHANPESNPSVTTNFACTVCHDKLGDSQFLSPARMVVSCEACHGGGGFHVDAGGVGPIGVAYFTAGTISTVQVSAQFATCTGCHELLSPTDPASAATTTAAHDAGGSDPRVVTQGSNSNINSITDTHFAKSPYQSSNGSLPTGFPAGSIAVSGYAMDYASERVCIDCHNPHGTATINKEWAQSAHANRYGASTGYVAAAWARSNWSRASSVLCQRCHTTTGMANYADALRSGDSAKAKQITRGTLASLPATTLWKPEMLKCTGCHTDNKGTVRNPGAITADYDYVSSGNQYAVASHAYPDVSNSNVCMICHTARESGDTLKGLNDASLLSAGTITFFNFSSNSLISSHFLTGGGTIFTATGYEFSGRDYSNPASYLHDKIGTSAAPNTGSSGPCVGCHMSRPNKSGNHIFMPVTRSLLTATAPVGRETATITGIASQVCWNCHDKNDALLLEQIADQKLLFEEARLALGAVMEQGGRYFRAGFYPQRDGTLLQNGLGATATNGSAVVTSVTATNWNVLNITGTSQFRIDSNGTFYTIATVDSGTQVTLTTPYAGATVPNARYSVLKAETVIVTNGSQTVTGASTLWSATTVTAGDYFRVNGDGTWYRIKQVNSDTSITLGSTSATTPYTGLTAAGEAYTIISSTSVRNWLTPAAPAPFTVPDGDTSGAVSGRNNMGAAFNAFLLDGEPAAYVHNRYYTKRLIYDSIDWIDDNELNFSTGVTLANLCAAGSTSACEAKKYILVGQQQNPYSAAERP